METFPPAEQDTSVESADTQTEFIRLTAAELGFGGDEMVEYGPYIANVNQTLLECEPISHLGPDIARMAIAQGIELYKRNHPESNEETEEETEEDTEEDSDQDESKKKLI